MAVAYQPRLETDPVWWNGTNLNTFTTSGQVGIRTVAVYGWNDRPDVRDVREARSGQDGEYADNLYLGGRTITLEGEVYGSTWVDLQARKRALAAVVQPASAEVLLKIPDPATSSPTAVYATTGMTGYERVSCRVVEAIQFGETPDPLCQTWQVVARASDPRVYSDTETSTDSGTTGTAARTATVDQAGTYSTPPTLTVTGPTASEFSVFDSSNSTFLTLSGAALIAGQTATLDVGNRSIRIGATYQELRSFRTDIVAGWMLTESSGTVADNFQGTAALDLTYTGGYTLNQTGPASGIGSVALNGSTGYVVSTAQAALAVSSCSVEAWVYSTTSTSGFKQIVYIDGATHDKYLRVDPSLQVFDFFAVTAGTSAQTTSSLGSLPLNTWTHVVATFDATTGVSTIYVNGYRSEGGAITGSTSHSAGANATVTVGRAPGGTGYFTGRVSAVTIYNRALSAVEAAELYGIAAASSGYVSGYRYLVAGTSRWSNLGTGSTTYTLASSGLASGSKLNVTYRDARI